MIPVLTSIHDRALQPLFRSFANLNPTTRKILVNGAVIITVLVVYDRITDRLTISRRNAKQAPKSKFGLQRADNFGDNVRRNGVDIIFVHGLGSNPDTTWGSRRPNNVMLDVAAKIADTRPPQACWVTDFLPEDIPEDFREYVRIFFYNYDSYYQRDATEDRLETFGTKLLHEILQERERNEKARSREIVFVGHSYGGLVIKKALVQARIRELEVRKLTRGVLFLGTPHRGSNFASGGWWLAHFLMLRGSNATIPREITYDSPFLADLHESFIHSVPPTTWLVNFYEKLRFRVLKLPFLPAVERMCVEEPSATFTPAQNIPLRADHYGLNKFHSKDDDLYRSVSGKIIDIIQPRKRETVYAVPKRSNETFATRTSISEAVVAKMSVQYENSLVRHAVAIHGMGGAGKTEIALKYAEEYSFKYKTILWIDATDKDTVKSSFRRCAAKIGLKVDETYAMSSGPLSSAPAVIAVLGWLEAREEDDDNWLVIIDNADDLDNKTWTLKEFMPKGRQGSILITSRDSLVTRFVGVRGRCEAVPVGQMEPEEAKGLILRYVGYDSGAAPEHIEAMAEELVHLLGYLPLALGLAGARIQNGSGDGESQLQRYLESYKRHQDRMLQRPQFRALSPEEKTVWNVWDTTIQKLDEDYPETQPGLLLCFFAKFQYNLVHDEVFRLASLRIGELLSLINNCSEKEMEIPEWLGLILERQGDLQEWDSFPFVETCELLTRFNLIQRTKEEDWPAITMHPLVKWRANLYDSSNSADLGRFLVGCAALQQLELEPESEFRDLLLRNFPKISSPYMEEMGIGDEAQAALLATAASAAKAEGLLRAAESFEIFRLEIVIRQRGQTIEEYQDSMLSLASRYRNQFKFGEAIILGKTVMKRLTEEKGRDYSGTILSVLELAETCGCQGDWKTAEKLLKAVIEREKMLHGDDQLSNALNSMRALAYLYTRFGMWEKALGLFSKIAVTRANTQGEDHVSTISSKEDVAELLKCQERWEEEVQLRSEVVERRIKTQGPKHPDTLASEAALAVALHWSGYAGCKQARKLISRVVEDRKEVLGIFHPDTIKSMADQGFMFMLRPENWGKFEKLMQVSIEQLTERLGGDHPSVLDIRTNLGYMYGHKGMWEHSQEQYEEVWAITRKRHGPGHPKTLEALRKLAWMHAWQHNREQAVTLYQECYEGFKAIDANHAQTAFVKDCLDELRAVEPSPL